MMILRTSPASPFGRKVQIAADLLELMDRIEVERADTASLMDSVRTQNPLGKIPVLIRDDGSALFDSRVIVEYFDWLAGGGRLIPHSEDHFETLRLQALADGMMEAGVLQIYETRFRPEEKRHAPWLDYQREKVERALAALEAAPPPNPKPLAGDIALACALGYLDFRFQGAWRAKHPRLVAWLDDFAARVPAFEKTRPIA